MFVQMYSNTLTTSRKKQLTVRHCVCQHFLFTSGNFHVGATLSSSPVSWLCSVIKFSSAKLSAFHDVFIPHWPTDHKETVQSPSQTCVSTCDEVSGWRSTGALDAVGYLHSDVWSCVAHWWERGSKKRPGLRISFSLDTFILKCTRLEIAPI